MTKPKHKPYKFLTVIILSLCLIHLLPVISYAHSGRTDADGGHYNSDTGEYHYHHGYPAHQHTDGVCPYNFKDKTNHSSSGSSGSSGKSSNSTQTTIDDSERKKENAERLAKLKEEQKRQSLRMTFSVFYIFFAIIFEFAFAFSDWEIGIVYAVISFLPLLILYFVIRTVVLKNASPIVLTISIAVCFVAVCIQVYVQIKKHPSNRNKINVVKLFRREVFVSKTEKERRAQEEKARLQAEEKRKNLFEEKKQKLKEDIKKNGIAKIINAPHDVSFNENGEIVFLDTSEGVYGKYTAYVAHSGKALHTVKGCSGACNPVLFMANKNMYRCSRCKNKKVFSDKDSEWFEKYRQLIKLLKKYELIDSVPNYEIKQKQTYSYCYRR
mgnify:FL=1